MDDTDYFAGYVPGKYWTIEPAAPVVTDHIETLREVERTLAFIIGCPPRHTADVRVQMENLTHLREKIVAVLNKDTP